MTILDTTVISELLRPAPEPIVEQWLSAQNGLNVYLTSVSLAELRYGLAIMGNGKRRAALVDAVDQILCEDLAGRILPCDSAAAQSYCLHRRRTSRSWATDRPGRLPDRLHCPHPWCHRRHTQYA